MIYRRGGLGRGFILVEQATLSLPVNERRMPHPLVRSFGSQQRLTPCRDHPHHGIRCSMSSRVSPKSFWRGKLRDIQVPVLKLENGDKAREIAFLRQAFFFQFSIVNMSFGIFHTVDFDPKSGSPRRHNTLARLLSFESHHFSQLQLNMEKVASFHTCSYFYIQLVFREAATCGSWEPSEQEKWDGLLAVW